MQGNETLKRSFHARAIWDEEDQLWISESDILGLHIEAETLEEFDALVSEFGPELIATNHFSDTEIEGKPLREIIPTVIICHGSREGHAV